ncbi:MAG: hypothetical protein LBK61_12605 [Spirochaetaceae bacterium]|nr:hypothetical protein [Spirochaetaceae bacterium]
MKTFRIAYAGAAALTEGRPHMAFWVGFRCTTASLAPKTANICTLHEKTSE